MYFFRADGSAAAGAGHLMRCLTVAQELQKLIAHPEEVCFLCAEEASAELLRSRNQQVKVLGTDPADLEGELPVLEQVTGTSDNIFLVDSYRVTDAYLQGLHRFGTVFLLDDMQQHSFPVNGVINYNLFASAEKYQELYGSGIPQYLGAPYVPVRRQFCEAAQEYTVTDPVTDILITTGGGDQDNIAGEILRELCEHSLKDCEVRYHLVAGRFNPNREKLEQYAALHKEVMLHCDVQDMAAPLLEEMKQRIFRLERLADNAADLVAQSQPPRQLNWTVQEMTVYLAQLCDAANHELEECAVTGRVHLQPMPQNQPVWAQIDLAIVQTMFANLFSNSLRANPAAKITISCTGRTLEYHDGRIWPEAACAQLAGVQTPEALANGCTGLLLVYRCAQNLGWRLETAANQETVLRMTLPPEPLAAFGTHNVLRTPRPESGAARLREEFRATLPPKKL